MNCGPFSQDQLETLRAASNQISNTWEKLVEPIKKFGEKYGAAQISDSGGFMDRTPEAEAKFRKALVKAGLLQDNSNIQPLSVFRPILYPYDALFPPKETTNGKTEDNRSQIDSTESHGQIRDSASLDRDPARNQQPPDDAPSGNQGFQRSSETKAKRDGSPETGILKKLEDRILRLATLGMKEKRDKLDEKHKRRKEKGTGKARNASGADAVPGNGQSADGDQLSA